MAPGHLTGEVFQVQDTVERDGVSQLASEHLGIPTESLDEVAGEKEV